MNGIIEGRIVHVVLSNNRHRPAIINCVNDAETGDVGLTIFLAAIDQERFGDEHYDPTRELMLIQSVPYNDSHIVHTWHWPERA